MYLLSKWIVAVWIICSCYPSPIGHNQGWWHGDPGTFSRPPGCGVDFSDFSNGGPLEPGILSQVHHSYLVITNKKVNFASRAQEPFITLHSNPSVIFTPLVPLVQTHGDLGLGTWATGGPLKALRSISRSGLDFLKMFENPALSGWKFWQYPGRGYPDRNWAGWSDPKPTPKRVWAWSEHSEPET